jgi:asparagine synthase (glutamine-hydrolysing)
MFGQLPNGSGPAAVLFLGSPSWPAPGLQALAASEGSLAAIKHLLTGSDLCDALASLGGSFALAVPLDDGRTVLAVDPFGQETLCYRISGKQLLVASRADLLGGEDSPLDPQALFDYLYFHVIPSPRTVYTDVHRLPPGHMAVWDGMELTVQAYWRPQFTEPADPDFKALRACFLDLVQSSVADQLDGSKAACFLSGGTDSSTVAGMITRVRGEPVDAYSIGFDAEGYDEMAYARLAARHFGAKHHEYYVTPDDLVRNIPRLAAHHDQPFGNSSALPAYCCAEYARADGVSRLLAGDGGDELFGGNSRYATQRVLGWYRAVPGAIRHGLLELLFERTFVGELPLLRKGRSYIEQAKVPMPDRLQMYNLLRRLGLDQVLQRELLDRVDPDAPLALQRGVWTQTVTTKEINSTLAYDWRFTLAENDLPKVRTSTQLAGVAAAYPLLDHRLVAFSLQLPAAYKLRGLHLRWFFKEALRDFLPSEIISKRKHGFGLPFGSWALSHAPLRALATESLQGVAERGLVKPRFVKHLLDELLPNHPGYYGELVWILMMLEQWMLAHRPGFKLR